MKKTFAYQNELPSLPIPSLNETMDKLLEWIEPIVSEEQFQETKKVVRQFFENDGQAEKLQSRLIEWDQSLEGSWLKPFWDDMYLKHRGSLPTSMNFNVLIDNKGYKNRYTRSELAGKVGYLVTELYHSIIDEVVEPEIIKGIPLDMGQYKNFFRSVRIPKLGKDEYKVMEFDKKNNHIIIAHKNNFYKVNVSTSEGEIYPSREIAIAIESIFSLEDSQGPNVGIFTTAERDQAAEVYDQLTMSKVNAENLQIIADSLVVISIDEDSNNSEEAIENLLLNGTNKYFDKTIQIILTKNGELGYCIEHTAVDGTTIYAVISHVNEGLRNKDSSVIETVNKPLSEKMEWEVSEETQQTLESLQEANVQTRKDYYVDPRIFEDFGSDEIKSLKISPDAFFHMALQLAQYRTFGMMRSVYEPVAVRIFNGGRTESARSLSTEKLNLVKALEGGKENSEELYQLMQVASQAHSHRLQECQQGLGIERHMYGLEQMYHLNKANLEIKELPKIFNDEGFSALRHNFISTSGIAYDGVRYRVFGPVVEEGYGLAYVVLSDSISINVSCHARDKESAEKLADNLAEALKELRQIAKSNQ